jgi:hypothetical protein
MAAAMECHDAPALAVFAHCRMYLQMTAAEPASPGPFAPLVAVAKSTVRYTDHLPWQSCRGGAPQLPAAASYAAGTAPCQAAVAAEVASAGLLAQLRMARNQSPKRCRWNVWVAAGSQADHLSCTAYGRSKRDRGGLTCGTTAGAKLPPGVAADAPANSPEKRIDCMRDWVESGATCTPGDTCPV